MQKLKFHHVGMPTSRRLPDSDYNQRLKLYGTGYFDNPYGIEWHNFDADNSLPDIIKMQPHIAFVVDDVYQAIVGKEIVLAPNSPTEDVVVAFILDHDMLIELIQFNRPEQEIWPHHTKFQID